MSNSQPLLVIDEKIPFLKGRLEKHFKTKFLPPSEITPETIKNADGLLIRTRTKCDNNLLKNSSVKFIATATIGMDHIDMNFCANKGITVNNAEGCNAPAVAQYVWTSLLRKGFDQKNDILGIIGYGNIGKIVAEWADKTGTRILVNDPPKERTGDNSQNFVSLNYLLQHSDAITIHTPLTLEGQDKTFHLISEKELKLLKPGSLLINAARGGIVNEKILKKILEQKRIRAILDVWENEPSIDFSLIPKLEISTPHIAGYSLEGKQRATRMILESLEKFFNIEIDKENLEGEYHPVKNINAEIISNSYNPEIDSRILSENPEKFEEIRENYDYRHEPFLS